MIIEHHVFRLAAGVDEADFLAADVAVQTGFAPFQQGFVRRTTARGADGQWLIETFWYSHDDAQAAVDSDHAAVVALAACVDPSSESRERFETLD